MACVALCTASQNLLVSLPAPYLGGALQTVLSTASVPGTMLVSALWLRRRYTRLHLAGAAAVMGGIGLAVWRDLAHGNGGAGGSSGAAASAGMQVLWVALFVAGTVVPVAVVEERWLKGSGLGVVPFRGILAPWELVVGLVLLPTLLIRLPGRGSSNGGTGAGVRLTDLPQWLYHGLVCFTGGPIGVPQGDCAGLPVLWLLFCGVNVVWVLSALVITKRVSAAALSLATAVSLPATTCLFQVRFVAGSATQHGLTWWTIAALVVTTAGFAVYRWKPEIDGARTDSASGELGGDSARWPLMSADGADPGLAIDRCHDRGHDTVGTCTSALGASSAVAAHYPGADTSLVRASVYGSTAGANE